MLLHRPFDGDLAMAYLAVPGPGTTTVYLGGLGASGLADFAPVLTHPLIAGSGAALSLDLLGSGWSDHDDRLTYTIEQHAESIASLLDALGLQDTTVVGHSLGGSIGIVLATARPDLVGRLIVAEPNLDAGVGSFSVSLAAQDEAEFCRTGHTALVARLRQRSDAVFARTVAAWDPAALHRTAVSLLAGRSPTFRRQLMEATMPRTFILGSRSMDDVSGLVDSGCEVRVLADSGHEMTTDNLDGLCALLHEIAG